MVKSFASFSNRLIAAVGLVGWGVVMAAAQPTPVAVPIRQVQLNGIEVLPQPEQPLILDRPHNSIRIRYDNPFPGQSTRFSFRIEPGRGWQQVGQRRDIFFRNVPSQNMIILIRASHTSPEKNAMAVSAIKFMTKPFWQKLWFWPSLMLLGMASMGLVSYLFFQARYRQLLRMQLIRDQIARDLHDDMGSYLSSISILSATMPADPARARQNLDRIGQTARQVMEAMSDIVWSINPAHDTIQQVVDRMKQVANELFSETDTDVSFVVGPGVEALSLALERRRDFFLIYKESLTNVARYAQASSVSVRLDWQSGQLSLCLHDNGCGFDTASSTARPGGGNGLRNMKARAALLGGHLSVRSAPGQGTQIDLIFPV
ncbi:sensor histidine kinase [Fibrella arboris]|uniref:sensor histidine kinase n=1 Tax=Fibrella arboris TaxID=3242486 RepID=UPI003522C8E4